VRVRDYRPADLDALYAISLATGHAGGDAAHLYRDGRMMGHIYSAPYATLEPGQALIAEDGQGIAGFALGALDTEAWEKTLEASWWPHLREVYADPGLGSDETWSPDQRRRYTIHHPSTTPTAVAANYPAHLHINILPRLQGRGLGRRMLDMWIERAMRRGAARFHVGVNNANKRGLGFWAREGFQDLAVGAPGRTIWMGRSLDRA
jgi:ribosomal protein S18 acetylase RimI-like enzyme